MKQYVVDAFTDKNHTFDTKSPTVDTKEYTIDTKGRGKFLRFHFLLKRIISGKFGTKNMLPIMRKHYRTAALLHDAFRKPHRQKVSLKPK